MGAGEGEVPRSAVIAASVVEDGAEGEVTASAEVATFGVKDDVEVEVPESIVVAVETEVPVQREGWEAQERQKGPASASRPS